MSVSDNAVSAAEQAAGAVESVAELIVNAREREARLLSQVRDLKTEAADLRRHQAEHAKTCGAEIEKLHASILQLSDGSSANTGLLDEVDNQVKQNSLQWFTGRIRSAEDELASAKEEVKKLHSELQASSRHVDELCQQAKDADVLADKVTQLEASLAKVKSAHTRVVADRSSYKRKLESLQKDTRKLISSRLQIEQGLQELRDVRDSATKLEIAEVCLHGFATCVSSSVNGKFVMCSNMQGRTSSSTDRSS